MKFKLLQRILSFVCTLGMICSVAHPIALAASQTSELPVSVQAASSSSQQDTSSAEESASQEDISSSVGSQPSSQVASDASSQVGGQAQDSSQPVVSDSETAASSEQADSQQTSSSQSESESTPSGSATSQPESEVQEQAEQDGLISYDRDLTTTDGWQVTVPTGSVGGMDIQAKKSGDKNVLTFTTKDKNESNNPAYALAVDNNSPSIQDGEVVGHLTANAAGRFVLVFRYQDPKNYAAIGYDVGNNWVVKKCVNGNETSKTILVDNANPTKGVTIKATFAGGNLELSLDGTSVYRNADFLSDLTNAGKLGVRTWGYAGNYASITVDQLSYNQIPDKETDEEGNYKVTFTDKMKRGGWEQDAQQDAAWQGQGISFKDGQGDDGYMTVAAGPNNTQNGNSYFVDSRAPYVENGFIEMDITNQSAGRVGVLFRYNSSSDFAGLMYDVGGTWKFSNGTNNDIPLTGTLPELKTGVKYHLRVEYVGQNIHAVVSDMQGQVLGEVNQTVPQLPTKAGQIGLRVWGYSSGMNLGKADVDNVVNGLFNAVLLTPSNAIILEEELGSYDVSTKLSQTSNKLVRIKAGGLELVKDKDYTQTDDVVTFKAEYLKNLTDNTVLTLEFEDGYLAEFNLRISKPEKQQNYLRDFAQGIDGFAKVTGSGDVSFDADKKAAVVKNGSNAIFVDQKSPDLHNAEAKFQFDPNNDNGNLALVLRYQDQNNWVAVGVNGLSTNHTKWYVTTPQGSTELFGNQDNLTQGDGDGQRLLAKRDKPYTIQVRLVEDTITVWVDGAEIAQATIQGLPGGSGKVGVRYNNNAGASIYKLSYQTSNPLKEISGEVEQQTIQSKDMTVVLDKQFPRVISYQLGDKTMEGQQKGYHAIELNNTLTAMNVTAEASGDTAVYHMTGKLDGQDASLDVRFTVTGNVLEMKLEKLSENIKTVNFPNQSLVSVSSQDAGASLRQNNYMREVSYDVTSHQAMSNHQYTTLAVVNNNDLAGVVNCGSYKSRSEIAFQIMGNGAENIAALWPNEFIIRGLDNDIVEGGDWAKVAIVADRNGDNKVDYQDGAIALRDDIPTQRYTDTDTITSAFTSIAVNEASGVQYPFLNALDQVKKMSLALDNFPQIIVYKGYQSQGHDSAHPSFADINPQAGGEEAFKTLIAGAANYNTTIGVHINETEVYPEAPQFGALASMGLGGWSWFDDSMAIVRENDILSSYADKIPGGNMESRLDQLSQKSTKDGEQMSMVYVDTYFDSRWPAYRLANSLNNHGWAMGTEYVDEFTGFSVWGHHIDGRFNNAGNLVRFVNNGTQDIFATSDLFRGPGDRHSYGVFGWQADNSYGQNYQKTLETFYTKILPNKYLANFPIMKWENNNEAYLGENQQVRTYMENGVNKITVNGKLIANGNTVFIPWSVTEENKIYHWNQSGGTTTWDLPDSWNDVQTVKIFKLSDEGRTDMKTVTVKNHQISITADAKTPYVVYKGTDNTMVTDMTSLNWGEGNNIKDGGFDSHTWGYAWNVSSSSGKTDHITYSNDNENLITQGDTSALISGKNDGVLTQTITGLEGGKTYVVSVYAVPQNGKKAEIRVTTNDGTVYSNFADDSDAVYGSSHSSKKASKYQLIKVEVTVPEGQTTAQLQLIAGQGSDDSSVRFDDVRVYQLSQPTQTDHYFFDNFNDFSVGFGAFVNYISGKNHMSEKSDFTNDVIEGRYSLKIQNFENTSNGYAKTVPSALRLPANAQCTVSVDYLVSGGGNYTLAAMEGDKELGKTVLNATGMGAENKQTATFTFTTGDTGKAYLKLTRTNGTGIVTVILDNMIVDVDQNHAGTQMKLTAQAEGTGGTAVASSSAVNMGDTAVVTIQPQTGYAVDTVTVNGVAISAPDSNKVTLNRMMEDTIVNVTFKEQSTPTETPSQPEPTPTPDQPNETPLPEQFGITKSDLKDVPESLKQNPDLNTVEKIVAKMHDVAAKLLSGSVSTLIQDIHLMKFDGNQWVEVSQQDFPKDGVTIELPYPQGTSASTHNFVVTHMLTSDVGNKKAGDVETPTITLTETGIRFTLHSLSPVGLSWAKKTNSDTTEPTATPKPNDNTDTTSPTPIPQINAPQTGDNASVIILVAVLIVCVAALVVVQLIAKNKKKQEGTEETQNKIE